jgi:5,6-dimethylbenzimidazole synthase
VVGDPKKTGADMFLEEGNQGYLMACSAAIQNMILTAHSLGLGSLWFTLYDKKVLREMLGIDAEKDPIALVCLGKPGGDPLQTPRKAVADKTTYMK